MKLSKALSQRIKALRERAGLSQQEMADKCDLSLSMVAKLEQGRKTDPRTSTLLALADALGVKPGTVLDDLFPPAAEQEQQTDAPSEEGDGKPKKKKKKKDKKKG